MHGYIFPRKVDFHDAFEDLGMFLNRIPSLRHSVFSEGPVYSYLGEQAFERCTLRGERRPVYNLVVGPSVVFGFVILNAVKNRASGIFLSYFN